MSLLSSLRKFVRIIAIKITLFLLSKFRKSAPLQITKICMEDDRDGKTLFRLFMEYPNGEFVQTPSTFTIPSSKRSKFERMFRSQTKKNTKDRIATFLLQKVIVRFYFFLLKHLPFPEVGDKMECYLDKKVDKK